jgi:hypothetical protein
MRRPTRFTRSPVLSWLAHCRYSPDLLSPTIAQCRAAAQRTTVAAGATVRRVATHDSGANAVPAAAGRKARAAAGMTAATCTIAEVSFTE